MATIYLKFFYDNVKTGAPYDIKQPGKGYSAEDLKGEYATYYGHTMRFDDFGNYNYGVAAEAYGLSYGEAKFYAGLYQIYDGQPNWNNWDGFFDETRDTQAIYNGYYHLYDR